MKIRSYSELRLIETFEDRFRYLAIKSRVGVPTFGNERYINQRFYTSREWRQTRFHIIARDNGCDLGIEGHEVHSRMYIHHMNPMEIDDIRDFNPDILDPEFLISVTHRTHNAIHYGDESLLAKPYTPRAPGDTTLW